MKDYDHQIIWLDYFNKNLSRKKGRKVGKNISVYDPTMQELIGATKTLDLDLSEENINNQARYPRRSFVSHDLKERKEIYNCQSNCKKNE